MTIQSIGSASVALYITPADLKQYGLTPAELTLERALELTRTAFQEAGERWWLSLPGDQIETTAFLSEFGRCETDRPHLDACLAEHGRRVLEENALDGILTYFPV